MVETGYLTNQYLIATPFLLDPSLFSTTLPACASTSCTSEKIDGVTGNIVNQSAQLVVSNNIHQLTIQQNRACMIKCLQI